MISRKRNIGSTRGIVGAACLLLISYSLWRNNLRYVVIKDLDESHHSNSTEYSVTVPDQGLNIDKIDSVDFGSSPVGKILEERRRRLMKFCNGRELLRPGNNSELDVKNRFFYDRGHQFVYCAVQKVGSTLWKRLFQVISGMTKSSNPYEVQNPHLATYVTFRHFSFDILHAVLEKSAKFVIVRNPYSRLFSGFADKLFLISPDFWAYGKYAIKRFRKNASEKSLRCGHDVTFPELVKYFIYSERVGYNRNGHFIPITDHCRPCQIKYNIIAKMETFKEDTLFVLKGLNMTKLINNMQNFSHISEIDTIKDHAMGLIQTLDSLSNCISKSEGLRRTWRSFQFRGYIGKDIKYPLSKEEEETIDGEGLNQMFQTALEQSGKRETRLKNRQLILEEAYSQVSIKDFNTLSEIFNNDCGAFEYDCKPGYIFNKTKIPKTNFLDIWRA